MSLRTILYLTGWMAIMSPLMALAEVSTNLGPKNLPANMPCKECQPKAVSNHTTVPQTTTTETIPSSESTANDPELSPTSFKK